MPLVSSPTSNSGSSPRWGVSLSYTAGDMESQRAGPACVSHRSSPGPGYALQPAEAPCSLGMRECWGKEASHMETGRWHSEQAWESRRASSLGLGQVSTGRSQS